MAARAPSFDDLAVAFQHGNVKPLYFFYGDEGFLMDELQALLVEHALEPHERDFNLDLFHGPDADAKAVLAACMGYPVMAARRVVIVRQFEKLFENRAFKEYAAQPNPTAVVLLLCTGKPNLSAHPYRALREHAVTAEFKALYDRQMPGWLDRRAKAAGVTLEAGAAQMLAQTVGTDLRSAAAEIDKLRAYAGTRTTITEDDVLAAGGHGREFNVFELQKALGQADRVRTTAIVERMLAQAASRRGEALMIVTMLSRYVLKLRKLAGARGMPPRDLARHIGVNPYFLKEYEAALHRLGLHAVRRALEALLAADYELKGGSERDERLVLLLALGRIVPTPPPSQLSSHHLST
ncbi:MAG: DNA polymerase III subunit delta [Bacteroidota bacterium]